MTEVKIGDKIRIVKPDNIFEDYSVGDVGVITGIQHSAEDAVGVYVEFEHYTEPHSTYVSPEEFELVKEDDSVESIRSKILSIREKRSALLMEIEALDKEEAELVEKLKQQGFVLYEGACKAPTKKKTVLYAEDIEEDMNDPKNWKVGDLVTVIENDVLDPFYVGEVVELLEACENPFCKGEGHSKWAMTWEQLKFHSRPL